MHRFILLNMKLHTEELSKRTMTILWRFHLWWQGGTQLYFIITPKEEMGLSLRGHEHGRTGSPGTVGTRDLRNIKRERKVGGDSLDFANRHRAIILSQITRKKALNAMGLAMFLNLAHKISSPLYWDYLPTPSPHTQKPKHSSV